ncbi:uncharacterized protein LOC125493538 [Beta vulgaris subsp. vulgaris]|uniref:uncharacterized protein LOC125493538 n=1 Tax=Beta vulgaris subsp. vulgaris TaxID=3555 RepID=UPI002037176F|nr:uncharacterized protein LOC125493538 [Beta vulgaris subsp. vulgaris]
MVMNEKEVVQEVRVDVAEEVPEAIGGNEGRGSQLELVVITPVATPTGNQGKETEEGGAWKMDRRPLWVELGNFVTNTQAPCLMMGDYNAVRYANDRIQGTDVSQTETVDFSNFMEDNQLTKAPSCGMFYSWNNKGVGYGRTQSRIDKAIVNSAWIAIYSDVVIKYLPAGVSDHTPLLFSLARQPQEGGRPFRFLNFLAEQEGLLELVQQAWEATLSS